MSSLLILTVGTGTTGDHSNLAQGLVNTLHQLRPRLFWLVPSSSPDSMTLAEIVRDEAPEGTAFQSWNAARSFREIAQPDDLFGCRAALREVIRAARQHLRRGESLILNPTSGTKQMSVAATLAALDEEIGEIVFTVGERADGVVKTGTESMARFNTRRFFLERDLRLASELFAAGTFFAAARILKRHSEPEALQAREKALCLHEWQRMNYDRAASHAARFSEDHRRHLNRLAESDEFSVDRLGDLLAGADESPRWGDGEEALARYYRGAEQAAKVRLAEAHGIRPPYRLDAILQMLPAGSGLAREIRSRARNGSLQLGNRLAWRILEEAQDPLADAYFADQPLQDGLQRRNETMYGHGHESVDPGQVRAVADRLKNLLRAHLPAALACWTASPRPQSLS